MKFNFSIGGAIAAFLLTLLCWVAPAHAANPEQVQKLLQERICVGCDLSSANLRNADLRGVNLTRANLRGADLRRANLAAASLRNADLRTANLTSAKLIATDFSGANLKNADITEARYNELRLCHTVEPNGKISNRDCR